MPPRLYCPLPMHSGMELALPPHAAKHVQVLRLQPGDVVELFHGGLTADNNAGAGGNPIAHRVDTGITPLSPRGRGVGGEGEVVPNQPRQDLLNFTPLPSPLPQGESEPNPAPATILPHTTGHFTATITHMGRSEVRVQVGDWHPPLRATHPPIHIACGIPANDRMDWLVEKATELGATSIQPLITARSVLRLSGERATKRIAQWQAAAIAACEQSGRTAVPRVLPVLFIDAYLQQALPQGEKGLVLSLQQDALPVALIYKQHPEAEAWHLLSGPEGGLSLEEQEVAKQHGWQPASLGPYTLRAETAPLAALAQLAAK